MKNVMLSCNRFRGSHTEERICQQYDKALVAYGIAGKVSEVVSYNASNVCRAFSIPGVEEGESDEGDSPEFDEDIRPEDDELSEDHFDMEYMYIPEHQGCYAHTLKLCVKIALKLLMAYKHSLERLLKLVSHVRKSKIASELLEGENKLQPVNATRWNSQLKSLRSVLKIPREKMDQLDYTGKLRHYKR